MGKLIRLHPEAVVAFLLFSLLTLSGCGPGQAGPAAQQGGGTPELAAPGLPAPGLIAKATSTPKLSRLGREFDPAYSQRLAADGDDARLTPAWVDNHSPFSTLAYGLYRLNLAGYGGTAELRVDWSGSPPAGGSAYAALGNWARDRWEWYALPASGPLSLPAPGFAPYVNAGSGEMLVVLLCMGQQEQVLHEMSVPEMPLVDNWPMYQHDAQHTGRSTHTGPATNALKWKFADPIAPGHVLGSVAVSPDGHAYVAGDYYLYSFNPDGSFAWKSSVSCSESAPAIAPNGTIYVSNPIGDSATPDYLYAFNPDGTLKWSCDVCSKDTPALAEDGTIIFSRNQVYALNPDGTLKWTTSPDVTFGPAACGPGGAVYAVGSTGLNCFNADGTLRWVYVDPDGNYSTPGPPVVDSDGTVYIDGGSTAVDPDGALRWQTTPSAVFDTTPVIGPDHTLYMICSPSSPITDYSLVAKDNVTGATKWQTLADDEVHTSPVVNQNGTIVYGDGYYRDCPTASYHHLHAVSPEGAPLWTTEVKGAVMPQLGQDAGGNVYCTAYYHPVNVNYPHCRVYALDHLGTVLWASGTGEGVASGSAVVGVDGRVYAAYDNGNAYALTPDGAVSWMCESEGGDYWGSPALLNDGTLYMPSFDDNFYAINDGGTLKWTYPGPYAVMQSSPSVGPDGTVYIGDHGDRSYRSVDIGYDGVFYAFNPDGTLKWSHTLYASFYTSAAIGLDGTVYVASAGGDLHAFDADGNVLWDSANGTTYGFSSVSVGADGTLYCGGPWNSFSAFNSDGTTKWTLAIGCAVDCAPALALDGTIYVSGYDGVLRAPNPDGTVAWTYAAGDAIFSSPIVDGAGRVYFGSWDDNLYALNPDGTLLWTFATGGRILTSPTLGLDGTVYIGSEDGYLYAIGPGAA
jgi:outer membrane protein assembly factor BamB